MTMFMSAKVAQAFETVLSLVSGIYILICNEDCIPGWQTKGDLDSLGDYTRLHHRRCLHTQIRRLSHVLAAYLVLKVSKCISVTSQINNIRKDVKIVRVQLEDFINREIFGPEL